MVGREDEMEGGKGEQRPNPADDSKELVDVPSTTGSYYRMLSQEWPKKWQKRQKN